jgi:hypothetical protein
MERLLAHTFFEKLEYDQKIDISDFENLLFIIKNIPQPTTIEDAKKLTINLMACQRALYLSLLFHFEPADLYTIKELPISAEEIISQFDEAMDEVLKKYFGKQ